MTGNTYVNQPFPSLTPATGFNRRDIHPLSGARCLLGRGPAIHSLRSGRAAPARPGRAPTPRGHLRGGEGAETAGRQGETQTLLRRGPLHGLRETADVCTGTDPTNADA